MANDAANSVQASEDQIKALQNNQPQLQSQLHYKSIVFNNFASNGATAEDWRLRYPYVFHIVDVSESSNNAIKASFRLPINPQDLTITTPFAIKTTVTSGGILEEHNGAPLKQITINGTTGINIARDSQDGSTSSGSASIVQTIFSSTISATDEFINSIKSAKEEFGRIRSEKTAKKPAVPTQSYKSTGYYQYNVLRIFLETYANIKKFKSSYRLVFEMQKDKQAYFVTPNNFITKRNVGSPLETLYTISMTAWAAVDLKNISASSARGAVRPDISRTQKLFNALRNARRVTAKFYNIVSSARADIESNIFGPMNSVILLTKDILGIPPTLADFPNSIVQSFETSVARNWESLNITGGSPGFRATNSSTSMSNVVQNLKNESSASDSAEPNKASPVPGQQSYYNSSVFNNIDLKDSIDVGSLDQSPAQQLAIEAERQKALNITENDMVDLAEEFEALAGALSPSITPLSPTDEEWDMLYSINESILSIYAFIANGSLRVSASDVETGNTNISRAVTALDYWEANTAAAGITFNRYPSKFAIPFPFKGSLEELARIYLGDATLWMDIAAVNGLQAPYVDEDGFSYSFISNGSGNKFNVPSSKNLYVGQTIYISSDTEVTTKRKIQAINEVTPTNFQIIVDGQDNMGDYRSVDDAQMKAYLPYTVNSMKKIWIPTTEAVDFQDSDTKPITYIDEDLDLVKFSKIDLLLDSNFDLAIASDGFANLAYGSTNLLQAAKLKVATIAGSKLLDPNFGGGVEVGESAADLDIDSIVKNINTSFSDDSRFNAPSRIEFDLSGNTLLMTIYAQAKNQGEILPITIPLTE